MITVDTVATPAMVRFGNDAELDVTANKPRNRKKWFILKWFFSSQKCENTKYI